MPRPTAHWPSAMWSRRRMPLKVARSCGLLKQLAARNQDISPLRESSLRICLARCPGAETWILKQRPDLETTVIRAMGEPLDTKIDLFEDDDEVTSGMLYAPKLDRPQLTFLIDESLASPVSSQGSSTAIQVWPLMPPHPTGLETRMMFQLASTAYPRLSWMETSRQSRTRIAWVANVDDPDPSNSATLRRTWSIGQRKAHFASYSGVCGSMDR